MNRRHRCAGLPGVIRAVYAALSIVGISPEIEARQVPAVPIKKSVFPDYIVCLEDGKKLKMLKRHLLSSYGMKPEAYRAKWGLPHDYPMVAPSYASHRSNLAKTLGLGRKPTPATEIEVPVQRIPERKRGRPPGSKNRQLEQGSHPGS